MKHYRIYPIGPEGTITGPASEINLQNDFEALAWVPEVLASGASSVEVWQGARLVATCEVGVAAAVPPDPHRSASRLPAQIPPQPEVATVAV